MPPWGPSGRPPHCPVPCQAHAHTRMHTLALMCTHWPSRARSPALHGGQPPPVHASPRPPTAVPLALMGAARPQAHSWMWPLCPGSLSVPGRGPQTATPAAWPASRGKSQRPAPMHTGSPAPRSGPTSRPQAPQDHSPQLLSWGAGRGPAPPPSSACFIRGERASLGRPRREVWVVGWGRGRVPWHPASRHWDQKSRFLIRPRGETGCGGSAGQKIRGDTPFLAAQKVTLRGKDGEEM